MFDVLLESDALTDADDASVVAAIAGWARAEAAAAARRHAAVAELIRRRCSDDDERRWWACDGWDATAAEVAAALNLSPRRASSQMHLAQSLDERLPRVAKLLADGRISARLVSAISWRTHLVVDSDAMAAIDTAIAEQADSWGPLSDNKLDLAIDMLIEQYDPQARVWFQQAARGLDIEFGKPDDATGTRSLWGRMFATHAELADRKLTEMARGVCDADPRTIGQRRSEALGAILAGTDRIMCQCGDPKCSRANPDAAVAGSFIVHVVAEQAALQPDPEPVAPAARPAEQRRPAALLAGGGVIPNPLLQDLIRAGAKVVPLRTPCDEPEPHYRPSVALQRFVRSRDLTCRFPGCGAPADRCDIDHTVAYPAGPTHPSNLKCLCRKHHLLKTFWSGADGWSDQQLPDGTVVWTSPAGRTYSTHPGSRIAFPDWNVETALLPSPGAPPPVNHGLKMPLRRRTRTAGRAQRIKSRRSQQDTS